MYDLIIIGSGPAGLTASIYAQRAMLNTLILERMPMSGGQVINTYEVDNYPGLPGIDGFSLAMKLREHAEKLGAEFAMDEVLSVTEENGIKKLHGKEADYEAKALILAMGAGYRALGIPGEAEMKGHGVSNCATCDGAFFRGKDVAVIGGGDVAVEDAIYLARMCNKVYVVHRRDELRADKILQKELLSLPNVEMVWNSNAVEVIGENTPSALKVKNKLTGEERELPVSGVFVAVGIIPETAAVKGFVELNEGGYVIAGENTETSVPGVFAAGDLRTTVMRQIITACADGAVAVQGAERYISSFGK